MSFCTVERSPWRTASEVSFSLAASGIPANRSGCTKNANFRIVTLGIGSTSERDLVCIQENLLTLTYLSSGCSSLSATCTFPRPFPCALAIRIPQCCQPIVRLANEAPFHVCALALPCCRSHWIPREDNINRRGEYCQLFCRARAAAQWPHPHTARAAPSLVAEVSEEKKKNKS